jgi:thiol-disulfide isomerase/thioredoxin
VQIRRALIIALLVFVGTAAVPAQSPGVIDAVRSAIAQADFARGERLIAADRQARGVTPELLEALSWLGRGALAAGRLDPATSYARQTSDLARSLVRSRGVDADPHLAIAVGAAIEVTGQVLGRRGARSEAVGYLQQQLAEFRNTSIAQRIQKNINLLTLEGHPAPALDLTEHLGPAPVPLTRLRGKVVLLFFWAHWCPDCKQEAPILGDLQARFARDLVIVAPTQRYGYAAGGQATTPAAELRYIDQVRQTYYKALLNQPAPVSEANMRRYGVSTTPTLVILDRAGIVRLYHPGQMTAAELTTMVQRPVAQT